VVDVLIRDTEPGDEVLLAQNLREQDMLEVRAYGYAEPLYPLHRSVRSSVMCWTAFADGHIAAILGCGPVSVMGGVGAPWMMGTPVLEKYARQMVKRTPEYLDRMLEVFPHLTNFVHVANTTSKRWLRRVGFELSPPMPFGALREPFHRFDMRV